MNSISYKKLLAFLFLVASPVFFIGCADDDLDDAVDATEDAAEDAADEVEDAAEETGDAIEDATN